jgi:hypothetical protein
MGLEAAQRVLKAIKATAPGKAQLHKTRPELVVRMSTAPPAAQFAKLSGPRSKKEASLR